MTLLLPSDNLWNQFIGNDPVKLVGHALLQHLPDEAMLEAVELLLQMREFYGLARVEPKQVLSTPAIPARWGATIVQSVHPVTEDDHAR